MTSKLINIANVLLYNILNSIFKQDEFKIIWFCDKYGRPVNLLPTLTIYGELEAQGPFTGHRSIIAILYCFSFKYMKREKGRDLTQYTNLCGLNTLPH